MNQLIAALPPDVRQRWLPRLQRVELPQGLALHESGSRMSHACFPTTAVVSLVYESADGASTEFAVVGHEGMVGVELLLGGGSTPSRAVVRMAGEALLLPAWVLHEALERPGPAARLLLRYTMALMAQVAQSAVCNRHHALDRRLSRWLLMGLDRVQGDEIAVTQAQVAHLLGVRREGVTEGARRLQELGLIRCARGRIQVLDRAGLAKHTCECYAVVKQEYERLLPEMAATSNMPLARVALPAAARMERAEAPDSGRDARHVLGEWARAG